MLLLLSGCNSQLFETSYVVWVGSLHYSCNQSITTKGKYEDSCHSGSPDAGSYSHELATTYADEARSAGHDVRMIDLATEDFDPVLRYGYRQHMEDESGPKRYQEDIAWADHLVFSFPIWWSAEPAILKGFLDRTLTPGFGYPVVSTVRSQGPAER